MSKVQKKTILLFCPDSFDYQHDIKNALSRIGYEVDVYDERPSNTFIVKVLIRINRNYLSKYIDAYYKKNIESNQRKNYDFVLILKGESISMNSISLIKRYNPNVKMILYLWDSIRNSANALKLYKFFDSVYSFDREDCTDYKFAFLPLFYLPEYKNITDYNLTLKNKFVFIGTVHSDRYIFLQKIKKIADEKGLKYDFYMFFRSKILYVKMKYIDKMLPGAKMNIFKYNILSKEDTIDRINNSQIVVDIQHPKQNGLTMRTIETLGARRKLITTNTDIINYDFYRPENILIVDRKNPIIPEEFISTSYFDMKEDIYIKYSLDNWVKRIISI